MSSKKHGNLDRQAAGLQRVVNRSFMYVYFPVLILALLFVNFVWEVIRTNMPPETVASSPLRFTLINLPTTAALLGAIGALLIGRMQWAHANRPSISYAIDDEDARFKPDSSEWRVWLHNGGPGVARIAGFQFIVRFVNQPASVPATLDEINRAFGARGLVDGEDYFIRWLATGSTLAPASHYTGGMLIARFSIKALAQLDDFNIEVNVTDGVGDMHQRTLLIADRLPSIAKNAVLQYRQKKDPLNP